MASNNNSLKKSLKINITVLLRTATYFHTEDAIPQQLAVWVSLIPSKLTLQKLLLNRILLECCSLLCFALQRRAPENEN